MCSRTSVNRLKAHNKGDDDDDPLECEVALFSAALQSGHVAVHRHHVPVTHRRHLEGAHILMKVMMMMMIGQDKGRTIAIYLPKWRR